MEKVTFMPKEGEAVDFYVLEQTTIGGVNYLLVADSEEDDGEALILKDLSADGEAEALYRVVDDDEELESVMRVFELLLEDVEITL